MKPKLIQLVAWDVYGTIIASGGNETSDVEENEISKLRPGALEALDYIKSRGVLQVTASDRENEYVIKSLREKGIDWRTYFDEIFHVPERPKDYSRILSQYKLKPENLLVIGDSPEIDLELAEKQGCHVLPVPEQRLKRNRINIYQVAEFLEKQ